MSIRYPCEEVRETTRGSGSQFTREVQIGDRNVGTIRRFMAFETGWPHWGREEVQGHTRMLQHLTVRRRKRSQQTRQTSTHQGGRGKLGDLELSEGSVSKRIKCQMLWVGSWIKLNVDSELTFGFSIVEVTNDLDKFPWGSSLIGEALGQTRRRETLVTVSVVLRPVPSASSGSFLEMQVLRLLSQTYQVRNCIPTRCPWDSHGH